jgi:hypothetical protein
MRCRSVSRCRRGSSWRPGLLQRLLTSRYPTDCCAQDSRSSKIDYIDLITEFSAHSINDRLYRPNDSHWNIAGNELAARLILQHVSAQLRPVDKSDVRFTPKNGHWPDRRLNSSGQDFIKILRGWSTNYPSWEFWPPIKTATRTNARRSSPADQRCSAVSRLDTRPALPLEHITILFRRCEAQD